MRRGADADDGDRVVRSASFRVTSTTLMNGDVREARQDREFGMNTLFLVALAAIIYEGLLGG